MGDNLPDLDLGFEPIQISMGKASVCALSANSEMKCWGYNGGSTYNVIMAGYSWAVALLSYTSNVDVGSLTISKVSVGDVSGCAQTSTNNVRCWGYNAKVNFMGSPS